MNAAVAETPIGRGGFAHRAAVFCMTRRHHRDAWEDER